MSQFNPYSSRNEVRQLLQNLDPTQRSEEIHHVVSCFFLILDMLGRSGVERIILNWDELFLTNSGKRKLDLCFPINNVVLGAPNHFLIKQMECLFELFAEWNLPIERFSEFRNLLLSEQFDYDALRLYFKKEIEKPPTEFIIPVGGTACVFILLPETFGWHEDERSAIVLRSFNSDEDNLIVSSLSLSYTFVGFSNSFQPILGLNSHYYIMRKKIPLPSEEFLQNEERLYHYMFYAFLLFSILHESGYYVNANLPKEYFEKLFNYLEAEKFTVTMHYYDNVIRVEPGEDWRTCNCSNLIDFLTQFLDKIPDSSDVRPRPFYQTLKHFKAVATGYRRHPAIINFLRLNSIRDYLHAETSFQISDMAAHVSSVRKYAILRRVTILDKELGDENSLFVRLSRVEYDHRTGIYRCHLEREVRDPLNNLSIMKEILKVPSGLKRYFTRLLFGIKVLHGQFIYHTTLSNGNWKTFELIAPLEWKVRIHSFDDAKLFYNFHEESSKSDYAALQEMLNFFIEDLSIIADNRILNEQTVKNNLTTFRHNLGQALAWKQNHITIENILDFIDVRLKEISTWEDLILELVEHEENS